MGQKPIIKLEGYEIEEIHLKEYIKNEKLDKIYSENPIESKVTIGLSDKENNGKVNISIKHTSLESEKEIKVSVNGYFEIDLDAVEASVYQDAGEALSVNGVAIVFPYVRSILSMVTSLDGPGAIVLPTINTEDIFKN